MKWTASLLILIGLSGAIYILGTVDSFDSDLGENLLTTTYQFLLFAVAGGATSWIAKSIMDRREIERKASELESQRRQELREQQLAEARVKAKELRELNNELIRSYNTAKQVRRHLRARALRRREAELFLLVTVYISHMDSLMDVQLTLEFLKRHMRSRADLKSQLPSFEESVQVMDRYLRKVLGEYESIFLELDEQKTFIPVKELPKVQDLIEEDSSNNFFNDFVIPFERCTAEMAKVIGKLSSDRM